MRRNLASLNESAALLSTVIAFWAVGLKPFCRSDILWDEYGVRNDEHSNPEALASHGAHVDSLTRCWE
jgi:hypothetical protein